MRSPYGDSEPRIVEQVKHLFIGRADCYGRQTGLEEPKYLSEKQPLGDDVILRHLHSDITIGPYCKDQNGLVKWFAADFDPQHHADVMVSVRNTLAYVVKTFPVKSILVEQSQQGQPSVHLWGFIEPTPVRVVHLWGEKLKRELNEPSLEFFPKVGDVDAPLGMLVKLPGGVHRVSKLRSVLLTHALEEIPAERFAETLEAIQPAKWPDELTEEAEEEQRGEIQKFLEEDERRRPKYERISLPIDRVVDLGSLQPIRGKPGQYRGEHPVHGSPKSGVSFHVDTINNRSYCFQHGTGGGSLELYAVKKGIIHCEDCKPGVLRGEKFREVVKKVIEDGLLPETALDPKPEAIGTIGTEKKDPSRHETHPMSPENTGKVSTDKPDSVLLFSSTDKDLAAGVYRYRFNAVEVAVKIDREFKDHLTFTKKVDGNATTYTDRVRIRDSEHSRKQLIGRLEEKQILFKGEAQQLVDLVSQDLNARLAKYKQPEKSQQEEADLSSVIENEVDPQWLIDPPVLRRGWTLLSHPRLKDHLAKFISGFLVSDEELREDLIYNQVSVCSPPLRRYSREGGDYVNERGQEALIILGPSGGGKGAIAKLQRRIGVRVVMATRITRSVLERYARQLLHHTTLIIAEIETLYHVKQGRDAGEQEANDVATVLKQAIEDNKITLIVMEHDEETGNFKPRVYTAEVYPAPIMTSILEINDVQMATRAKVSRLPETLAGFVEIGNLVSSGLMLDNPIQNTASDNLTADDVKLVLHLIAAITEGLLWSIYQSLEPIPRQQVDDALAEFGITSDYLKPVEATTLPREYGDVIYGTWLSYILQFVLPPEIKLEDEDQGVTLSRKDLMEDAFTRSKSPSIIETLQTLDISSREVEGLTRDLLHAYRRAQSNAILNMAHRKFTTSESGGRILEATEEDAEAGISLLKALLPARMKVGLTSYELRIIEVLRDNPNVDMEVKEVAGKVYGATTEARLRYIRRVLNKAAGLKFLVKTPGKPLKFKSELGRVRKATLDTLLKEPIGTNGTENSGEPKKHTPCLMSKPPENSSSDTPDPQPETPAVRLRRLAEGFMAKQPRGNTPRQLFLNYMLEAGFAEEQVLSTLAGVEGWGFGLIFVQFHPGGGGL
ncbi:MAG: hypothetical protein NTV61_11510 [Candidatus Bathyarchaeota archaeon]|nr:hypothetical protein [Candidatus Bathyarchaeota archaeon]